MKGLISALVLSSVALFSCSDDKDDRLLVKSEHHDETHETKPVAVNKKMAIEVSGMSCEHACGGAIRMKLKDTKAVDRVSFDFKDGRKTNTCYITYNDQKIKEDKIIALIQETNDHQFTTGKHSTEAIKK